MTSPNHHEDKNMSPTEMASDVSIRTPIHWGQLVCASLTSLISTETPLTIDDAASYDLPLAYNTLNKALLPGRS